MHVASSRGAAPMTFACRKFIALAVLPLLCLLTAPAAAHGVAGGDKGYIQEITGVHLAPFAYLGAKHMITGYDHLLFLLLLTIGANVWCGACGTTLIEPDVHRNWLSRQ